jgi:hypothetical protein
LPSELQPPTPKTNKTNTTTTTNATTGVNASGSSQLPSQTPQTQQHIVKLAQEIVSQLPFVPQVDVEKVLKEMVSQIAHQNPKPNQALNEITIEIDQGNQTRPSQLAVAILTIAEQQVSRGPDFLHQVASDVAKSIKNGNDPVQSIIDEASVGPGGTGVLPSELQPPTPKTSK